MASSLRGMVLSLSAGVLLSALTPVWGNSVPERPDYEVTGVETSDGVWLATDVYLPGAGRPSESGGSRVPAVLIRTPYGREQFRSGELVVQALVEHGFAVVAQDVRGKYGSTGEFLPFVHEQSDGLATLDWIVAQPWSNGRVGMWGSSYLGFAGLVLLPTRHPALETVFHLSGWLDGHEISAPGGTRHLMLILPWLMTQEYERQRRTSDLDFDALFRHLPLSTVFESVGLESRAWKDESIIEPPPHDFVAQPPLASVFHLTGWYDFVASGVLAVHQELVEAGFERQHLKVGPWLHNQFYTGDTRVGDEDFGPQSRFGLESVNRLAVEWFTRELGGASEPRGDAFAKAEVFVMGADEWRRFDEWPPAATEKRRWTLRRSGGSGRLDPAPHGEAALLADRLPVDPNDPVPTWGGAQFHFFGDLAGVRDQREIEARSDVLTYSTEPLTEALDLLGPARVVAYLSTDGRDADLAAKLVVVRPDGYAKIVTEGIVRASRQDEGALAAALQRGEKVRLEVALGHTAIRVAKGERIRVELAGTNFPKYDRNPHSGVDAADAVELLPATHTIHSSLQEPSILELTVAPPGDSVRGGSNSLQTDQGGPS